MLMIMVGARVFYWVGAMGGQRPGPGEALSIHQLHSRYGEETCGGRAQGEQLIPLPPHLPTRFAHADDASDVDQ